MEITKLAEVADVLDDMQSHGIISEYAVGGAVAAVLHSQPISTIDLDIFFLFDPPQTGSILSLEPIYNYCMARGFKFDSEFIYIAGWPVQFVESGHVPLWREALARSKEIEVDDRKIKVLPKEHLAAMWAEVARKKDIRKIEEFDEGANMDAAILKDVLQRFGLMEKWKAIQGGLSHEYRF